MNETFAPETSRDTVSQSTSFGLQKNQQFLLSLEMYQGRDLSEPSRSYLDTLIAEPAIILLAASKRYLHPTEFESVPINLITDSVIENEEGLYCRRLDSSRTRLHDSPELCASLIGENREGESLAAGILIPRNLDCGPIYRGQCYSTLARIRRYYNDFCQSSAVERLMRERSAYRYVIDPDQMSIIAKIRPEQNDLKADEIENADRALVTLLEQGLQPDPENMTGKTAITNFSIAGWNYILVELEPRRKDTTDRNTEITLWDNFAHRLNNKLSALQSASDQLSLKIGDTVDACNVTLAEIVKNEADYIAGMMQRMEQYRKCGKLKEVPLDLNDLLSDEVKKLTRKIDPLMLQYVGPDREIKIIGDRDRLSMALNELIQNAVAGFSPVRIGCRLSDRAEITIFNKLSRKTAAALFSSEFNPFEPFRTLTPYRTGMGLTIAEKIIKAHNGIIEMSKENETGILVKVTLPLAL